LSEILYNISFKEHLTEDGHNRWPKNVGGYAACNTVNLHICVCTCWSISHNEEVLFGCLNKERKEGEVIGANGEEKKIYTNIVRNLKKGVISEP